MLAPRHHINPNDTLFLTPSGLIFGMVVGAGVAALCVAAIIFFNVS